MSLQPLGYLQKFSEPLLERMSQGYHGCYRDIRDCFKDASDKLQDTDELWISITHNIHNHLWKNQQFDLSVACLRINCAHARCHKGNKGVMDQFTDVKYDP